MFNNHKNADQAKQGQEIPADQPQTDAAQPAALSPSEEMAKLREELTAYKDKYLRLMAEFDNARKRMDREKQEFIKFANEGLVVDFLNVLDDLERSMEAAKANHQDYAAFLKGIEMVMAHIYDLLKKNGVKPLETRGKKFDPNFHEVLMQEESDAVQEGTVLEELQKGYLLSDRVVRTAKVKLAKKKES